MKIITLTLSITILFIVGCGPSDNTDSNESATNELKTGGIYATRNDEGKYSLSKILVLEDEAIHIRLYNEEFDEIPKSVSSDDLTFLLGHAPMARKGFLSDDPKFVTLESVSDSELAGYRMYIDAMKQ